MNGHGADSVQSQAAAARNAVGEDGNMAFEPSHPIPIGETVVVVDLRRNPPRIEGRCVIKEAAQGRHLYRVQFIGDPCVRERFVHPSYQADPDGCLTWLSELSRLSRQPDSHEEFFPTIDE
jgi:hypothetical protein